MLVLFETAAGYAIFKLLDDDKLARSDNLYLDFESPAAASKIINLKYFHKFEDITEALAATTAAVEGKLCKPLKKTLKKYCKDELHEQLAVADAKLGNVIKDKLGLSCVSNTSVQELMRCIRSQMDSLLLEVKDMTAMRLGLAHSLSRYKLKFSPDKVDTMVIQAVGLLDELDKELNNYVMRCREWYGWHFPELSKIITDNMAYVKTVHKIGIRENVINCDLSDILPEDIEEQVKEAAELSMGTEISEDDALRTQELCTEIIEFSEYRAQLHDYVKTRMMALAPNLSILVGELVGARLMSHAGSLINLAKHPASTVQILGAEKALFRALKTKKDTPKYGLIYHSQLVGQSSKKNKGKMSRMLAAKASLATRFDALGESTNFDFGIGHKAKLETRLRFLEEGNMRKISGTAKAKSTFEKYHSQAEYAQYSASIDSTLSRNRLEKIDTKQQQQQEEPQQQQQPEESQQQQEEPQQLQQQEEPPQLQQQEEPQQLEVEAVEKKKKRKKKKHAEIQEMSTSGQENIQITETEPDTITKKLKKRKHISKTDTDICSDMIEMQEMATDDQPTKKKKRKKNKTEN